MYLKHLDLTKYIYLDLETDGLKPTRIWCGVAKNLGTGEVWRLIGTDAVKKFVDAAPKDTIWVGHNFISFDAPTLRRLCGADIPWYRIVDTLVLSYLYDAKMLGGHSLEAWGERLKLKKVEHEDWSQYSEAMLIRCVGDVELGSLVFDRLCGRMRKRGYSERSCALEHEIREIIDEQQNNGWYFDIPGAEALYSVLRGEERELGDRIRELLPPELSRVREYDYRTKADGSPYASYQRHVEQYPKIEHHGDTYSVYDWEEFNIGSPSQRVERLLGLGWKPVKKTKSGKSWATDEESIVDFAKESGIDQVRAIADWLVANGRANMVNTWLANVDHSDSRIHGRVFSCGAASRRMTHSGPNTANIPSGEAPYGHECRSLWTVHDKRLLRNLGYDSKACQMRCFVSVLPDPELGRHFWDTDVCADPHQRNADLIGIGRKPIKNVFYANMFGAYPPKLAATAGMVGTRKELEKYGTWIQEELYRVTPGLREATLEAQAEFRRNGGFLRCIDGGYVRCPSESAALNYKIQPAEAVLMKTASIMIRKEAYRRGIDHKKIGDIHDEGQHEVAVGQEHALGEVCVQAIRDAGEELGFRVPHDGDYKVGTSWAETH